MANKNNNWRDKVASWMTDPYFAAKQAAAIENTRLSNKLMLNKADDYQPLDINQAPSEPLDLADVPKMQAQQVARATSAADDSGVVDMATKLYAEQRQANLDKESKQPSSDYTFMPHGMRFGNAAQDVRRGEQAKNIHDIYDKVMSDEALRTSITTKANKDLLAAMDANKELTQEEQQDIYTQSIDRQLQAISDGINQYLYDINAPKSEGEWIAKNAINSSIMGQMLTSPLNVEGGERGFALQAMGDYGTDQASWWGQGLSTAGSLIIDTLPMMGVGSLFATPATKATMWGLGKIGGKGLQASLLGRGIVGSVGGSATLGGYNAASALTSQFAQGQFDFGEVAESAGHGAMLGGITGAMSPLLRGATAYMGKAGKVATMTGGLGAEAGIFTAAELAESDNPYDFEDIAKAYGKNVMVIGGLKMSNMPKTIKEYGNWYNEGKTSRFSDNDYKLMADYASANGFVNDSYFQRGADGMYKRTLADRASGNMSVLTLQKNAGTSDVTLAQAMYADNNVPMSLRTKIAARFGFAPLPPLLPNAIKTDGNVVRTYCTYPAMVNGRQVMQLMLIDEFEMPSARRARAYASEFSRTTARRNDILQTEAQANTLATSAMITARLNEQARRNGTTLAQEMAALSDVVRRINTGEASNEDVAYYQAITEGYVDATEAAKAAVKEQYGVEIDDVLNKDGNLTTNEDAALKAYTERLQGIIGTTDAATPRKAMADSAGVEDYIAINELGVDTAKEILTNPGRRAEVEQTMRSHYDAWLRYFDGQLTEKALWQKLGYDMTDYDGIQSFMREQSYFKSKASARLGANAYITAMRLLNEGRGVQFTEDGKVMLKGFPYPVDAGDEIAARYKAAQEGSGEPLKDIATDALKAIVEQGKQPKRTEQPMEPMERTEQPATEEETITQQMVDERMSEIDSDLQYIQADGVQRATVNGRPAMIVKGRVAVDSEGVVDPRKSDTEIAYIPLDENGRPIIGDSGKPIVEIGVKPSSVRIEDVEEWRSVDEFKRTEEQRIRDNNKQISDALRGVEEQAAADEQPTAEPTEAKTEARPEQPDEMPKPKNTQDLLAQCDGDRALALDVAQDELAKALAHKGKGKSAAETIEINKRIRTYQQMVDELSAEPGSEQTTEQSAIPADAEFVPQDELGDNHDGMEARKQEDGRYKWVGLQRGVLTEGMSEQDIALLDGLAKKLNIAIAPMERADSAVNGMYRRDGTVLINTNRSPEWTARWVAGHELLHDVARKAPELYEEYKQAVFDLYGKDYTDNLVNGIIEDYAASGVAIDREQAMREAANDFGGDLFASRDGERIMQRILDKASRQGKSGIIDRIKQWWENVKEWFSGTPYYRDVEGMLVDAYSEAIRNAGYEQRERILDMEMSDAAVGEEPTRNLKEMETDLKGTKGYTPTKIPGTNIDGMGKTDYSVKSIGKGIDIDFEREGDDVVVYKSGRPMRKGERITSDDCKTGIMKMMVDDCVEIGTIKPEDADRYYEMYAKVVNKLIEKSGIGYEKFKEQYLWLGETIWKTVQSIADKQYNRSLDVTLICKKNEAVIRAMSELQVRQGFGVTPSQVMEIYAATLNAGYQAPCPVCYVFSRYIDNGQYTSNLIAGHTRYDNDPYYADPITMSDKQREQAVKHWQEEVAKRERWENDNKPLISKCKQVLSWARKEIDELSKKAYLDNLSKKEAQKYFARAKLLDGYYRAALNVVSQADLSSYIKMVICGPTIKGEWEMKESAGRKMDERMRRALLDERQIAKLHKDYRAEFKYLISKGNSVGKSKNFEGDNPMGDVIQRLRDENADNLYQTLGTMAKGSKIYAETRAKAKKAVENSAKFTARQMLRGGIRQWSWSDNIEALAPDVALNAMQVGMLGGGIQAYSKQLEGIEMMSAMGAYANGSLMGKGMGYQAVSEWFDGAPKWQDPKTGRWYSLMFDNVVGVEPFSRNGKLGLFALNNMYDKAGNILVGMNDIHCRTAMADPRIYFIIPWHSSGGKIHLLTQMMSLLGVDVKGFKATDYTNVQSDKFYGAKDAVPQSVVDVWRTHDYRDEFLNIDGTKAEIAVADGQLTADQLHYRELHDAVIRYSTSGNADKNSTKFWATHRDWLAEIENDIFLSQLHKAITDGPGRFGVAMTVEDCSHIYPYEYWDKSSTFGTADVNGRRYLEYCRRLGVKPKFSGDEGGAEKGNFVDEAGYWKLLIDRRMYDRNGNYQDMSPINVDGFEGDFIDQEKTEQRFDVTRVADKEATSSIVDAVQRDEATALGEPLSVDYSKTLEKAIDEAQKWYDKYNMSKKVAMLSNRGKITHITQDELYYIKQKDNENAEPNYEIINDDIVANQGADFSIVRDRNKIDELEGEELVPMYRTFQVLDGRLYPPMATIQRGKKVHSIMEGDWWKSDENPDLALVKVKGSKGEFYSKDDDRISKKDGQWVITIDGEDKPLSMKDKSLSYYFNLKKGEKGDVATDDLEAAYNPYIHSSKSVLNDQFRGAYLRPNLVLVEVLVPKSEIDGTNRYKADYAKDGIGFTPWNEGQVIKQAVAAGHPGREVALSRYAKIGRVFTNAEWADRIDEELAPYKDKITLPFITFPPEVLRELANKGYKIEPPTSKKAKPYYEAWLKGEDYPGGGGGKESEATETQQGKRADESVLDYAKRMNEEYSVKRRFGGNSGYVGYRKSRRAVDAEDRGLRSISNMNADFKDKVNAILADNEFGKSVSLAEIKRIAKGMKGDEWHHTSMYGNRTQYYSAESIADKIMGNQGNAAIDPRIAADIERRDYRKSLHDKMLTDKDVNIEVDMGNGRMHTFTMDAFRSSDGFLFDIGKSTSEDPIEKQNDIRILNTGQVDKRELFLPEWYIEEHRNEIDKAVGEYNSALAKSKQELDGEFSVKANKELEKKSLVGIHNLTDDNLRYALKLGGLANPSTAVIDKDIMGLEGFGDISLIMPKSLVAKNTGKNVGTFGGDAYTPRFPKGDVVKYVTKDGEKAIKADYPGDDKFSRDFREAWLSYGSEYGGITPALYYMYKLENGGAKIVKAEAPKVKSEKHQQMIDKYGSKEWNELTDAEKQELVEYRRREMKESLKGADEKMVDKIVDDLIGSADAEDLAYKKLRALKMDYKAQQRAGDIDYMTTYRNAQDDVAIAGEQDKFNKWLADKSNRYGIEDRIFRGYTASGNRKYAPMTLANISKVMKEQGRAGAEIFMTKSPYSLRGKMLPVYKTLEQIKKNKSKLADTETYEKFRKEIGDEYNELIMDIAELPNVKYDDTHYILEDALLNGFDYAEKQANTKISDAVRERIAAFGNLLKDAPVKYFETKFERPVMFDEFVAAVVPKDIHPELRKTLESNGLAIEEYERGNEASRLEAVRRASDRDDVQFSVKQRKGRRAEMASKTDAEYEVKEKWRKDNAGLMASAFFAERRAEREATIKPFEDKIAQLKEYYRTEKKENTDGIANAAKEMIAYIKENIPTDIQGDMTGNQFDAVLKQLAKATRTQDLEKPMQMIRYIAANVERRSLARELRTFLKAGFKGMTNKGLVKAQTVDAATSRVLNMVKSIYSEINSNPYGSEMYQLRKEARDAISEYEDYAMSNGESESGLNRLNDIMKMPINERKQALEDYLAEINESGEDKPMLISTIDKLIGNVTEQAEVTELIKQNKADSAMMSRDELAKLKTDLMDKKDEGIITEEESSTLDNMPLFEMLIDLHQRQLDIDGPSSTSLAEQMSSKLTELTKMRKSLKEADTDALRSKIKANIKQASRQYEEMFAARIVDQQNVNNGVAELLGELKTIKESGHSRLKEWSEAKQKRTYGIIDEANGSFGKQTVGYWDKVDSRGQSKRNFMNWLNNKKLTIISPALSFEYMLGVLDPKYYTNDSPIYNRFIKGNGGLIKANDNFFEGLESYNQAIRAAAEEHIDRGALTDMAEFFSKGDRFAKEIIPFTVIEKGEERTKEIEMTRGQAAKIYAWSRMTDGYAKLQAQGMTDVTLERVKEFIGEGYMRFVDWVEDEYFPKLRREKYNPIYKSIYGISIAENPHYFPFEIYKNDIRKDSDLGEAEADNMGGGVVGNLVERRRNKAKLDLTTSSPDIFDMISQYGRKMEEWAAYAQVREDLKAVFNDRRFKANCDGLGSIYYEKLKNAAEVAARLYKEKNGIEDYNSLSGKIQKTLASAAISMRVSTALKQLLSAPSFLVWSLDPKFQYELIKTASAVDVESAIKGMVKLAQGKTKEAAALLLKENWYGHYQWCKENLPSFRERISKGGAGNPILEEKGLFKISDFMQGLGMRPNQLVDAFTCSIGAKAVYEYSYKQYIKKHDEKIAHNMAVTDAEIAFNTSQQSSNPVFLSPLQSSKNIYYRGYTNYKNSVIGYFRNGLKANIDTYRAGRALFGDPKFVTDKGIERFQSNGKSGAAMAATSLARALMYELALNAIWNFGTIGISGFSRTMYNHLFGNNNDEDNLLYTDEEYKKAIGDVNGLTLLTLATQGLPMVSGLLGAMQTGQEYTPVMLLNELNDIAKDVSEEGASLTLGAAVFDGALKYGLGINPEVLAQQWMGLQGIMAERPIRQEDVMNLFASPRSAVSGVTQQKVGDFDKLSDYIDARIDSERLLKPNEKMDFVSKASGKRALKEKDVDKFVDEYLAERIPDYWEIADKQDPNQEEEDAGFVNKSLVQVVVDSASKKEEKKEKKAELGKGLRRTLTKIKRTFAAAKKLYKYNQIADADKLVEIMQERLANGYNPDGRTLEERWENVNPWGEEDEWTIFDIALRNGLKNYKESSDVYD